MSVEVLWFPETSGSDPSADLEIAPGERIEGVEPSRCGSHVIKSWCRWPENFFRYATHSVCQLPGSRPDLSPCSFAHYDEAPRLGDRRESSPRYGPSRPSKGTDSLRRRVRLNRLGKFQVAWQGNEKSLFRSTAGGACCAFSFPVSGRLHSDGAG